jgi:hypothetical protein
MSVWGGNSCIRMGGPEHALDCIARTNAEMEREVAPHLINEKTIERRIEEVKKLIAVFAVMLLVAPAFAADWSFYGSERMATWYVSQDFGKNQVAGQDNDSGTQWYMQTNSRLGAKVKADKVSGQIELATTASSTDSAGDGAVNTRRA